MSIEPTTRIREPDTTVRITTAADLEVRPDAAFPLAIAPDGLPLAMHVRRHVDVRRAVLGALRDPQSITPTLGDAIETLERATRTYSVAHGIVRAERQLFYATQSPAHAHLGTTLVARMLGAVSPMVLADDVRAAAPARFESTAMCAMADLLQVTPATTAPAITNADARLWIAITNEPRVLVAATEHPDALSTARPIVFESLLGVRSAHWHARDRVDHHLWDGPLAEPAPYRVAIQRARTLSWSVSRVDAMQLVAELARSVDRAFHARGRVHADLKPGNVLLERTGIHAFDGLDVPAGEIAGGMTEGWAAPEQVFVRPLTPATDVYALGLMAAAALAAVPYGEEQAIVVPALGDGRRRLRMMKDPEIWVDPKTTGLPTEARLAWRELLMQCLAARPERRPARAVELADRMDALLARWELPGRLHVACGPGHLTHPIGSDEPMWILDDAR